jgi:hypothetical protein
MQFACYAHNFTPPRSLALLFRGAIPSRARQLSLSAATTFPRRQDPPYRSDRADFHVKKNIFSV